MRGRKKAKKRFLSWSSVLPVVIFLTSCNGIIVTNERFIAKLSQHQGFFIVFVLLLVIQVISDIDGTSELLFDPYVPLGRNVSIRELFIWVFFCYFDDDDFNKKNYFQSITLVVQKTHETLMNKGLWTKWQSWDFPKI
jgi:hypothetical protein